MRYVVFVVKKLIYECCIFMCWGDMDVMGYINNMFYFCYLEIVCVDWLV